ncbi:MAG: glycerol-3-phosphate 1-O-acyltransferase PlsY [Candidatus Omnitrophica bacterium]|nr:glycerol-3-phosphate 1-O-acyltransferase PlsY [Candidatus Omnitrophota bacterium]
MTWSWWLALAASYLVGSFPTGYVLVKWLTHQDVRAIGSGNVGATNVTRAAGPGLGAIVLLIDIAKGALAASLLASAFIHPISLTARLSCGLAAVVGHTASVFLAFRGGKGVATTVGVLLAAMPGIGLASSLVWLAGFAVSRYVSVGSLLAAISIPVWQMLAHQDPSAVGLGIALALLISVRHYANITRLVSRTEHRVSWSRRRR